MTDAATKEASAKALTFLGVSGLRSFLLLDAVTSGAGRVFQKEVLRVGRWVHPATGELIDITPVKLSRLVENTRRWLALGHKVHFPDGHTDDSKKNLGWWLSIRQEGEGENARAIGVVKVEDAEAAAKVGKTIQDVSPGIWWDAKSSVPGESFEGGVLEHICATPVPVLPGQPNFVALAREFSPAKSGEANRPASGKGTTPMLIVKLNRTALAAQAAAGVSVADGVKLFLGLPADASDADVLEALRQCLMEDDDEDAGAESQMSAAPVDAAGMATLSRKLETVEKDLAAEREERSKERAALAKTRILEVKTECARAGRPVADEDLKGIEADLASTDGKVRDFAEKRLAFARERAGSPSGTRGTSSLARPEAAESEEKKRDRHTSMARGFKSQGLPVEMDSKGFISRVGGKEFRG